jgi:hypothetical protein
MLVQAYSGKSDKLEEVMLKWIVQSSELIDKVYAKQFMAADPKIADDQKKALSALEYAVRKLGISTQSDAFNEILQGPVRSSLKQ